MEENICEGVYCVYMLVSACELKESSVEVHVVVHGVVRQVVCE